MTILFAPRVRKSLIKIKTKNQKLFWLIDKQIKLFQSNSKHPSLRVHKLSGKYSNLWSLSITPDVRILYQTLENEVVYFTAIGTHNQVYRK